MSILSKLGYGKGFGSSFRLVLYQWIFIVIVVLAPLVSNRVNGWFTFFCHRMAYEAYSPAIFIFFPIGILIFALQLYGNYDKVRSGKVVDMPVLDDERLRLIREGKDTAWIDDFRFNQQRRDYVWILTSSVIVSTVILYYGIAIFFVFVTRHHINVLKGTCTGLDFRFIEKIYVAQFLKDLPFSLGELFNLNGKCSPDPDVMAVKVMTSAASALHWFLILLVVGFIWGKQIKGWFFPEEKPAPDSGQNAAS